MSIHSQLKHSFSLTNLTLAWKQLLTNSEGSYKEHFRDLYSAFAITSGDQLKDLSDRLLKQQFSPNVCSKLYTPKKSGVLRMITLLPIEDQIVYQALGITIANKLSSKIKNRYKKTVFGNLYSGKKSIFFYQNWSESYKAFTFNVAKSLKSGFDKTATFDLTAFYDSIDHKVIKQELVRLKLENEFCDYLVDCLSKWTEHQSFKPNLKLGHGIPQGPLASGIIAEIVLARFDSLFDDRKNIKYFRYVDDIRLMGKDEKQVRKDLVRLDLASKAIGLFPQSGKIDLHKASSLASLVKSISGVDPDQDLAPEKKQTHFRIKFDLYTKGNKIGDLTKIKYLLSKISPNSKTTNKIIKLILAHPYLYPTWFRYLSNYRSFTQKNSLELIEILSNEDVYYSFSASLIRLLGPRHHSKHRTKFINITNALRAKKIDSELVASSASTLISLNSMPWSELQRLSNSSDWYVRMQIANSIDSNTLGVPNAESLANKFVCDVSPDVSLQAAKQLSTQSLSLTAKGSHISRSAQTIFKHSKLIQRYSRTKCYFSKCCIEMFGTDFGIEWKVLLQSHYKNAITKAPRWKSYIETDSTAWIVLTDTLIDLILDRVFLIHGNLGTYFLGKPGACLGNNSPLSRNFPKLYYAAEKVHTLRLKADLSHPVEKKTGKITRYVSFKEANQAKEHLRQGLIEIAKYLTKLP